MGWAPQPMCQTRGENRCAIGANFQVIKSSESLARFCMRGGGSALRLRRGLPGSARSPRRCNALSPTALGLRTRKRSFPAWRKFKMHSGFPCDSTSIPNTQLSLAILGARQLEQLMSAALAPKTLRSTGYPASVEGNSRRHTELKSHIALTDSNCKARPS